MKDTYISVIKFPALVSTSLIILTALFFIFALQGYHRLGLSKLEAGIFVLCFAALVALICSWILILMSTHRKVKAPGMYRFLRWMNIHWFFTMAKWLNAISFQNRETLIESFLNFNNEIVLTNHQSIDRSKILLLLPHCLQSSQCKIRVTENIINCEECGGCQIADLKNLASKNEIVAAVASGGSLARKLIAEKQPDVIIAVACHRDLSDGVRDAWRFPVYAVLNERPNGPCFETKVSNSAINFALKKFS